MDFAILNDYFVVSVVVACLIVGYITKKWIPDVDNKYIPTIVTGLGAILNLVVSGPGINSLIFGALMGLASTGLHQAFKAYIEKEKV